MPEKRNLKIALGMNLKREAFGGGNQFGKVLSQFLKSKNINLVYNLKDKDIDIILLTETRKWLETCAFDAFEAAKYIWRKPDTLLVFRINECDERKNSKIKLLNKSIIENAKLADRVVFISSWLKNLFVLKEKNLENKSLIIYNGADTNIFNSQGYKKWEKDQPLKIVTHHWGANWYKGFDIYLKLDELLEKRFQSKIDFTFIGNAPKKVKFKNTKIIPPQSSEKLAEEIKQHHIYLTASICEPAGMHHIEGALCGLPLLYRNSGALPEYCKGYGISFNGIWDFEKKLCELQKKYDYFVNEMPNYDKKGGRMSQNYYRLFLNLMNHKKDTIKERKLNIGIRLLSSNFLTKTYWVKEGINNILNRI